MRLSARSHRIVGLFFAVVIYLQSEICFADSSIDRPNILFVFADDWGRCASAYAKLDGPGTFNDVIRTPNFDRVASEGVIFRNAFVAAPSCTPSRSAVLSGRHFWATNTGSILLGAVWDDSIPSYPLLLRDAGYHIGKSHKVWSPGTPVDAPYGSANFAYEKNGSQFNQFSQDVTDQFAKGVSIEAAKQKLYDQVAANFGDFLKSRKVKQPFCYWFGPTNTHRQWVKGSGKALWNIDPDSLKGKLPKFLADVPEVREDFADYLGESQALDASLGVLLQKLEAAGELDKTMIVVTGDHGPPGFPHGKCNLYDFGCSVALAIRWGQAKPGRVIDDLVGMIDIAPTFLEAAGLPIPERVSGRSLIPLLKSTDSGQIDANRDAAFFGRERHVDRARVDYKPYPQRAIRTHDYLYIINFAPHRWPLGDPFGLGLGEPPPTAEEISRNTFVTHPDDDAGPAKAWLVQQRSTDWKWLYEATYGKRPREELYDLRSDPDQMNNVASDPKYAEARTKLEARLLNELRSTGDPRMIDDGRFFETPPMAAPATRDGEGKKKKKVK
jgi:arylsulfatase A-like enzyme